jgi:hypothetical protein
MMDIAIPANAQTQQRKRTKHHRHQTYKKNTTYTFPKAQKNRQAEKSIDDRTTGTEDKVKLNEKGKYHNMNANTGVELPPTSGENGK